MNIVSVYKKEEYVTYLLTPFLNVKYRKDNIEVFVENLYKEIKRSVLPK